MTKKIHTITQTQVGDCGNFLGDDHAVLILLVVPYVNFLYFTIYGVDVVEVDAELAPRMRGPVPFAQSRLVARVVHGLAFVEGLQEQAEAGRYAEGDQRAEFHEIAGAVLAARIGDIGGAVVLALPVLEEFQVRPSGGYVKSEVETSR